MNWLAVVALIGGFAVGYLVGGTRAHLASQRYLGELDRWIDKQSRREHGR